MGSLRKLMLPGSVIPTNGGLSQVGLGAGDLSAQAFINILKAWNAVPAGGCTPANLDADGYPTSPFTGSYGGQILGLQNTAPLLSAGPWIFSWPATRAAFKLDFLASANVNSTTGSPTITNGSGSSNFGIANSSGAGSVTFTFTSVPTTPHLNFRGDTGSIAYATGSGEWTMMRTSDVAKYAAGQVFTDEYIAVLTGLNPGKLRTMGWVNNGAANNSAHTKWKYRSTPTSLTWCNGFMHPDTWSGTITGTDFYTVGTIATDVSSGAWQPHETFTGTTLNGASAAINITSAANNGSGLVRVAVNSTVTLTTGQSVWVWGQFNGNKAYNAVYVITVIDGTHIDLQGSTFTTSISSGAIGVQTITITGKSGGAKFLASALGVPPLWAFDSFGAGTYQFYYDEDMDKVVATGPNAIIPIEIHCKIANAVNCHLWTTLPHWVDDNYATQWATAVLNNLNSHLDWWTEYSSEMWNTNFRNGSWAASKAASLNIKQASYYGLRYRQVMGLFSTVWASQMSRMKRCINTISVPSLIVGLNKLYVFDGSELGSYGYNASPNRPIDYCDRLVYAPYAGGCNLCNVNDGGRGFSAYNALALQNIVTLWEGGNTAGAIAAVDDDIRQGRCLVQTVTASGTTFTTPADHGLSVNFRVAHQVTGGTTYSGVTTGALYNVTSVPTTKTFTIQAIGSDGTPSGANVNAGSAGSGTTTVGFTNNMTTIFGAANEVHRGWESISASYDSDRAAHTPLPLKHHWYEGALEMTGPTVGEATILGLTGSTPSASIAAAILAWKNDATSDATIQAYYNTYKGLDSTLSNFGLMTHAEDAANLVVFGGGVYSLVSGNKTDDAAYQLYNGVADYNT